jgi:hypothetical protein
MHERRIDGTSALSGQVGSYPAALKYTAHPVFDLLQGGRFAAPTIDLRPAGDAGLTRWRSAYCCTTSANSRSAALVFGACGLGPIKDIVPFITLSN